MFAATEFADDCAPVLFDAFRKFDERRADLHDVALGAEHVCDASARRRWYFDHRLVGLDGNERLIGDDVIALADIPADDLRLFKTFAKIGQRELAHGTRSIQIQLNWQVLRAAVTIRSTEGI
ncbi:hypothetical protein ACVWXO_008781 [Bradyrhizobium sp. LM2.7]